MLDLWKELGERLNPNPRVSVFLLNRVTDLPTVTGKAEELFHNEQEAESQSDSSFPSDSEEKIELNAMNSSIPSDSESFNGSNLSESFELDQNSTRILGFYESLESESHNDEEDDDDDDDDDEDGLIEINFPSSHFSDLIKENEEKLESKFPDFLREDMFKQEGLMELLEEINEDESLIEIDISMGFSGDQCVVLSD
ncbi:nonsense-mediated mRNA decay protein 2-like [Senna tora]|uniref:Nonsense-mediated mRNA decay protein 2-like n=1 Tax=Senna tora TaxID=362788 RepID=A0A834T5T1_9FABA|nr:nonsense-mediated mRNA decay protein 2-like [Senna tora]